jgi:hypothetical protein
MTPSRPILTGPLQRPDLVSVLAYVNRSARSQRCVDGTLGSADMHLERLAAAAGLQ